MWSAGLLTADTIYCKEGGEQWVPVASLFNESNRPNTSQAQSEKRILPAMVLCLVLGMFGGHAFYAGRRKQGMVIIVCSLFPLLVFGWFIASPGALHLTTGNQVLWLEGLCLAMPMLAVVHALCDAVRLLIGSYKDGNGLKITKWT
jgi:hypothetical protein